MIVSINIASFCYYNNHNLNTSSIFSPLGGSVMLANELNVILTSWYQSLRYNSDTESIARV